MRTVVEYFCEMSEGASCYISCSGKLWRWHWLVFTDVTLVRCLGFRAFSGSATAKDDSSAEQFFIDVILNRHARKLLAAYRLHDLASFAANLEDYELVQWLRKEKWEYYRVSRWLLVYLFLFCSILQHFTATYKLFLSPVWVVFIDCALLALKTSWARWRSYTRTLSGPFPSWRSMSFIVSRRRAVCRRLQVRSHVFWSHHVWFTTWHCVFAIGVFCVIFW